MWNVSLNAVRSAATWWMHQSWITTGPSRILKRVSPH
jgi:hypothetical protein